MNDHPKASPISVLLAGCYGVANVGDELLLETLIQWIQELGGVVTVISLDPEHTQDKMKVPAVSFFDYLAIAQAMEKSDLFVMGGGGIFQDHYRFNISSLYDPASYEVASYARPFYMARQFGVKTMIWAHGVGPLRGDDARAVVTDVFNTADFVSVRDDQSRRLLTDELGVRRTIVVAPDPSWQKMLQFQRVNVSQRQFDLPAGKKIGLIVRDWSLESGWHQRLTNAIDATLPRDWTCVLIGFQTVRDTYISQSDRPFLEQVAGDLHEAGISAVVIDDILPVEAVALIDACDAVLSMRLHGTVIALARGKPTISFEYDEKMGLAAEMAGMPKKMRVKTTESSAPLISAFQAIFDQSRAPWILSSSQLQSLADAAILHRELLTEAMREIPLTRPNNWSAGNFDWMGAWTSTLIQKMNAVNKKNIELQKIDNHIANEANQSTQRLDDLKLELLKLSDELNSKNQKLSDLNLELLRISDWAMKMNTSPFLYAIKKHLRRFAKFIFNALPIDLENKAKLKSKILTTIRKANKYNQSSKSTRKISPRLQMLSAEKLPVCRDILIFSLIDWHFRIQRPQHLSKGLSRIGKRVFFISNQFIDSSTPGYSIEQLTGAENLYLIKLNVTGAPAIYFEPASLETQEHIAQSLAELALDFAIVSSVAIVEHAYWYPIARRLPNSLRVYDCMDHHEGFGNVAERLVSIERQMMRESDLVVVTSDWLANTARQHNTNVALVRNAGEYEHFATPQTERYVDAQGRKIIGYFGAIAEWFDLELVRKTALANPGALVLLVGNDTVGAKKVLQDLANVVLTGEVPYDHLPYYLHAFDVCLLPFKVNALTQATNPVKVYEYLASGLPVVCVDLPETIQFEGLVDRAPTADEFIRLVTARLSDAGTEELQMRRRKFASEQTWSHRAHALMGAIEAIPLPKVSVVVLTFNNLDLTKSCLQSLIQWSDYDNLEIIVVDNASTDGSQDYLQEFQSKHSNVKLILNDKNVGFAAGNNIGLNAASGDYLVMLNNDTVVTPGWALTFLRHMQQDPSIGLIGPVTNNIGNEAKIDIVYEHPSDMVAAAMPYTISHMRHNFPLHTAAFFCAMIPREVFEKVGVLDENFGRGFFEDDDYCRRIESLGMKIVCAEDVFVHHQLSASFNKLKKDERDKLFEKNKKYYETKWGAWNSHEYRSADESEKIKEKLIPEIFDNQKYFSGQCVICGKSSRFFYIDIALWRESLNCQHCRSTSRYRSIASGALRAIAELTGVQAASLADIPRFQENKLHIYDTQPPFYYEPCAYPVPDLLRACDWIDVVLSQYKPDKPMGKMLSKGIVNQNLECLTFASGSLDIVITSDVMEHVRLDERAHHEIHRVLKPGGIYIFTVPHNRAWAETLIRVQITDPENSSQDIHLLEPEYHGDTNNEEGGGVLAYRTYGKDLEENLTQIGFEVEYVKVNNTNLGIMNTELYYCRKTQQR